MPTDVSESCWATESSIGLGDDGSESDSGQGGDEAGSESASWRCCDANSDCYTGPLREPESASEHGGEFGSESGSGRGGHANSECSTGPLRESESASERGGDEAGSEAASEHGGEFGSESSIEPLHESGGTSSRSLNVTKDSNAALRFCGLANLSDLPKCAGNPIAELFGINACVNVISCADHVESLGAFRSMLPVLLCKLISEQKIPDGYTAIVDDVNADGVIILLHK